MRNHLTKSNSMLEHDSKFHMAKGLACLLSFAVAVLAGCQARQSPTAAQSDVKSAAKIINGQRPAEDSDLARSIVAVIAKKAEGQALCTGTILTTDTVLTAAHCVAESPSEVDIVFATDIHTANSESLRRVDRFLQNPAYQGLAGHGEGDLAVLHFSGGLPENYEQVTFVPVHTELEIGQEIQVFGYGVIDPGSHSGAGVLRQAQTQILEIYSSSQVLTDESRSGVCFGDSGGPGFVQYKGKWAQWGVASAVVSSDCRTESIHTSVMSFEKWLNQAIDQLRSGSERQPTTVTDHNIGLI